MIHKDGRFLNSSPHLGLFNGGLGGGKRILEKRGKENHFAWLFEERESSKRERQMTNVLEMFDRNYTL